MNIQACGEECLLAKFPKQAYDLVFVRVVRAKPTRQVYNVGGKRRLTEELDANLVPLTC
jgi:hypothetical protein